MNKRRSDVQSATHGGKGAMVNSGINGSRPPPSKNMRDQEHITSEYKQ